VQIADIREDPDYQIGAVAEVANYRSVLAVPMLRDGAPVGAITVSRERPGEFPEHQIGLLKTFADQAVIAIENARLFNETKEALEQQTATAEILRVIASSPNDVQPVFEVIVKNAVRLCGARFGRVYRYEGAVIHMVASHGLSTSGLAQVQRVFPRPAADDTIVGRVILSKSPYFVKDIELDEAVPALSRQMIEALGTRSQVTIPMLRAGEPIGVITMGWDEPEAFDDQQVTLLQTFADQAVIAIENVRLFKELEARNKDLGESLNQQTATSEILKVISGSPTDTQPVFDAIVRSAAHLFEPCNAGIVMREGDLLHLRATDGPDVDRGVREELAKVFPVRFDPETSFNARAILERRTIEVPDTEAPGVLELARNSGRAGRFRSFALVPLVRENEGIGTMVLTLPDPGFKLTQKQLALLQTFADQAVIAIENVRLLREIQEKSAQLEVANKHKSDFLANMSHELRTPLNAVIGFSEVLMERMFGEVNEKQADYLKDIHESGKHLLSLINDILDLSKIEAGRMELDLASFHLPTAISNAMTLVRERAQRHGIALGLDVDARLGDFNADERKVKQILLNLLSNAVKFTPEGGRVEVSARNCSEKVEIAVRDTGIGIAPEDQSALFEEFKQVGKDAMRKAEGTGLGLALTKRFVELHGGDIRVDSAPGKGSTFTVTLPVRQ